MQQTTSYQEIAKDINLQTTAQRMMRYGLNILLIILLAGSLAACGRSRDPEPPTPPTSIPTEVPEENEAAPAEENAPEVEEAAPEEGDTPAEEEAVEEEAPADEDTVAADEAADEEEAAPVEEEAPADEETAPAEEEAVEEEAPADEDTVAADEAADEEEAASVEEEAPADEEAAPAEEEAVEEEAPADEDTVAADEEEAAPADEEAAPADEDTPTDEETVATEEETAEEEAPAVDEAAPTDEDTPANEAIDDTSDIVPAADAPPIDEEVTQPRVFFFQPTNYAILPITSTIVMGVEGLVVEPAGEIHDGAGHLHILVDTDFIAPGEVIPSDDLHLHYGKGQLSAEVGLTPGEHTLRLQFANGAHIALDGDQYRAEIQVTVTEDAAEQGVYFVNPREGDTVSNPIEVIMAASGLVIEPAGDISENAGHLHILVNTEFVAPGEVIVNDETHLHYGKAQTETTLELEPGEYVLRLQLANGAHIALEGEEYQDEINIIVE